MCEKCSLLNPWTLLEGGRISLHQTVFQPTPWTVVSCIYWSSTSLLTHICKMTKKGQIGIFAEEKVWQRCTTTTTHQYVNVREMLVGMLLQSCHYWLHPCSNLAWTIGQNHSINWTVVDCCSQFLCSIVAARWTHDCFFFFFFFCYSAFSGPPSPPTLWFTNSEAEAMCNQNLFLGVMHAPFLIQKSNLTFWK